MEKNKSFSEAVSLLNKIESDRVEVIFERILLNNTSELSRLFSAKEREKFLKMFGIDEKAFLNLINAIYFLSMQAAFEKNFKSIETQLRIYGMREAHIEPMQKIWTDYAGDFINKIKEKPIAIHQKLENISWTMTVPFQEGKLPINEKFQFEDKETLDASAIENIFPLDSRNPYSLINFTLNSGSDQQSIEKFVVKMNKNEIQQFFEQLEFVQASIDGLFSA